MVRPVVYGSEQIKSSDDGRVNLIQIDANYAHISIFQIGIEIGSLEDELTHQIERDGMTKNSWILMRT